MSLLEVIGAFALFLVIVVALLFTFGGATASVEIVKDDHGGGSGG